MQNTKVTSGLDLIQEIYIAIFLAIFQLGRYIKDGIPVTKYLSVSFANRVESGNIGVGFQYLYRSKYLAIGVVHHPTKGTAQHQLRHKEPKVEILKTAKYSSNEPARASLYIMINESYQQCMDS